MDEMLHFYIIFVENKAGYVYAQLSCLMTRVGVFRRTNIERLKLNMLNAED